MEDVGKVLETAGWSSLKPKPQPRLPATRRTRTCTKSCPQIQHQCGEFPQSLRSFWVNSHHDVALLQHEVRCLRAVLFTKRSTVRVECQAQADPLLALTQLYACVTLKALSGLGFSADGGGCGWPRAPLAGRSDGIRCPMLS